MSMTAIASELRKCIQSISIIKQAIAQLPQGEIQTKVTRILRPPKGEAYGHIEGPKGEFGFYLVSDGSTNPYRLHIRPPSLINLTALRELLNRRENRGCHGNIRQYRYLRRGGR